MKPISKEKSTARQQSGHLKEYSKTNGHVTQSSTSPEEAVVTYKDSVHLGSSPSGVATDSDSGVSVSGVSKSPAECTWFTKPVHLQSARREYHYTDHAATMSSSNRSAGDLGPLLTAKYTENTERVPVEHIQSCAVASLDELVKEYFPFTLGASYGLRAGDPSSEVDLTSKAAVSASQTFSSPTQGLIRPTATPWKPKRSKSPRRTRPVSANSAASSTSKGSGRTSKSLEHLFLFTTDAPTTGK